MLRLMSINLAIRNFVDFFDNLNNLFWIYFISDLILEMNLYIHCIYYNVGGKTLLAFGLLACSAMSDIYVLCSNVATKQTELPSKRVCVCVVEKKEGRVKGNI